LYFPILDFAFYRDTAFSEFQEGEEMTAKRWHKVDGKWLYSDKKLTQGQAVKQYCINHCNGKSCTDIECPLFIYRDGHNPSRTGIGRFQNRAEKTQEGKYKPSRDGEKRVSIKAFSRDGKLRIILPSGDSLIVLDKEKNEKE